MLAFAAAAVVAAVIKLNFKHQDQGSDYYFYLPEYPNEIDRAYRVVRSS
jgi:hypothetical protein